MRAGSEAEGHCTLISHTIEHALLYPPFQVLIVPLKQMSFMLYLLRPETCDVAHKVIRERKIKEGQRLFSHRLVQSQRPYYSHWCRPLLAEKMQL